MDYKTAAREIRNGNTLPIYVCFGPEKFLMQEFVSFITEQLIEPEHREFGVSKFDLSITNVEAVIEDAETMPFMVPQKLIIARDASFFTAAKGTSKVEHRLEALQDYIQSPVDTTVLIFIVDGDKLDERKKLVKAVNQLGASVPFLTLSPTALAQWVATQAKRAHCTFATGAMDQLLLYSGTDLQTLTAEIEKLSLYVGENGVITKDTVERLVVRSIEQNIFILIEEMVNLRMDKAFTLLYDLLKMREEPIKIVMLMARQFRIMLQVKELNQQGFSQKEMASQLKLHPYVVKLGIEQSQKFDVNTLASILSKLADLDYQIKSGRIEKVLGLEMFLLQLAG